MGWIAKYPVTREIKSQKKISEWLLTIANTILQSHFFQYFLTSESYSRSGDLNSSRESRRLRRKSDVCREGLL